MARLGIPDSTMMPMIGFGSTADFGLNLSRRKGEGMASCLRFAFVFVILGAVPSARGEGDPVAPAGDAKPRPVNFARDVRPILSDNCFACHGPDDKARKAGLRLDTKEGAFAKLKSGGLAIVPGKPDESDLIFRIESDDPELHMPPKKSGKQLTADQVAIAAPLDRAGGNVVDALGLRRTRRSPRCRPSRTPAGRSMRSIGSSWPGSRPRGSRRRPMAEQDDLDPPRDARPDRPAADPPKRSTRSWPTRPREAYEKVVDRLLESPRYGEHMARFWLDAARYGDTHGLHLDNYREIWPYRDWVIRAFNANKPFDRFIVEQLAGDLLPNADPRPDHRHRLQPLPRFDQRGGLDRRGSLRPQHRRPGRYQRDRLPGTDDRLRPLP